MAPTTSPVFRNLADARRRFQPGQRVRITDHRYPEKSFDSIIRRNQAKEFALDCPPQFKSQSKLTWQHWPKAADFDAATGDVFWNMKVEGQAERVRTKVFTFELLD